MTLNHIFFAVIIGCEGQALLGLTRSRLAQERHHKGCSVTQ